MSETRGTDVSSPIPVRTAGLAAALGVWILWSGVVLTGSGPIILHNFLVGAAVAAFAAYAAAWPDGGKLPGLFAPLLVVLLGLWVVAASFVLEVAAVRLFWSNVIAGLLVAILASGSAYGSLQSTRSRAAGT